MKKANVFLAIGAALLLIACCSAGCISNTQEDTVDVTTITPSPTPERTIILNSTPIATPTPTSTPTPTPTPTPKSATPNTFVGNWTRELPASGFEETFEFKNTQAFTYRLVVKDEDDFNKYNKEYTQGSRVKSGHSIMQAGVVIPLPNGKYNLKINYCIIRNEKGQVCSERQFSYTKMVDFVDIQYDRESDGLMVSDDEQTTRFKRIA